MNAASGPVAAQTQSTAIQGPPEIFQVGDLVTWAPETPSDPWFADRRQRIGEGPLMVFEVEEVPTGCSWPQTHCLDFEEGPHHPHCRESDECLGQIHHPQWVTVQGADSAPLPLGGSYLAAGCWLTHI